VVTADQAFASRCTQLLAEEGFDTHLATSSRLAAERLRRGRVELVLTDLSLSSAGLHEVVSTLQTLSPAPASILVGNPGPEELLVRAHKTGATRVLLKPIDPEELSRAVAWAMHDRHRLLNGVPAEELEALYRMATAASSEQTLGRLLDTLLGICIGALQADSGSVMLAVPSKAGGAPTLSITASYGMEVRSNDANVPFGQGVSGWVAANARAVRLVGSLDNYPQFKNLSSNPLIAESMVAPIVFRREVLGTLSINARRVNAFGPEKLRLLISAADIAAAAIHRDRLEKAREHQDKLSLLGQLAASVTHELTNPLGYIYSNLCTLEDLWSAPEKETMSPAELDKEGRDLIRETKEGIQRMGGLVENLRAAGRVPKHRMAGVDLATLVDRAKSMVYPQFKHRVVFQAKASEPTMVRASSDRILQILINLMMNAAQAVGRDGREGRVEARVRCNGKDAFVEVSDNGHGIAPEVAAKLFEPFFTTKEGAEGTGLGLSISRQIAREHGGELSFESSLGSGTVFTLRLPLAPEGPALE
jgi:signal transduction histidine kinase/FixJ family two-component response regulator